MAVQGPTAHRTEALDPLVTREGPLSPRTTGRRIVGERGVAVTREESGAFLHHPVDTPLSAASRFAVELTA